MNPAQTAILKIFRPLIRVLLRYGISYAMFMDLARWVYVDVAWKDFRIEGRKQSISRISIITGISRKEVKRLRSSTRPAAWESGEKYNRAYRVISAWRKDQAYLNSKGNPAVLRIQGGSKSTFRDLVKRYSGDISVRAILDELLKIGAVKLLNNGKVALLLPPYAHGCFHPGP